MLAGVKLSIEPLRDLARAMPLIELRHQLIAVNRVHE